MTGKQLRIEIKKLAITQENAAKMLGIDRRTLQNWFLKELLDSNISHIVKEKLGIDLSDNSNAAKEVSKESEKYSELLAQALTQSMESNKQLLEANKLLLDQLRKKTSSQPAGDTSDARTEK